MPHAAPADLEPPLVSAALAPDTAADTTRDIELEAGFGERKVAGAHPHLAIAAVQRLDHVEQRALHVADRQALVDRKTLDLAEVRQPRRLRRVAAVAAAWGDDVDRRVPFSLRPARLLPPPIRPQPKRRGGEKTNPS